MPTVWRHWSNLPNAVVLAWRYWWINSASIFPNMSERHIPAEMRRLVADRGQHCCAYCRTQARYSADSCTVDHIIPRSLAGSTTADNLALCCHGCNQHTSRRTVVTDPVTATLVRLFHPREQRWGI